MNYQVLARKWRPKTFKELMGQEHVVSVLVNAIAQQRLHHAYLFTGTRGVGKTTIARIFAKSLNCEQGVTAEPCGKCDVCVDIDQGRFVDLLEIDAASRTKVDDTREILDNVQYAPTRGRYKVYLIDEVHMLSRSSFNALLKTLEEPPEHVKFILATTDPQKLPITVLSRCLQFHLKALSVQQIEQQLEKILSAENVSFEAETLTLLARAARGSMRDSLSLTDQAIAQGQGHITLANLQHMLGGIDQHWPYKILVALLKNDVQAAMALSKEIASYAPNYHRLFAELIQLLHHVALFQVVQQHFDVSPEHATLIEKFSKAMSAQDVQLYYQLALNGRKDLPYASDEQAAFDMTMLRLLAFKPTQASDTVQASSHVANEQAGMHSSVNFDDVELSQSSIEQPQNYQALSVNSEAKPEAKQGTESKPEDTSSSEIQTEALTSSGMPNDEALEQTLHQEVAEIEQMAASQMPSSKTSQGPENVLSDDGELPVDGSLFDASESASLGTQQTSDAMEHQSPVESVSQAKLSEETELVEEQSVTSVLGAHNPENAAIEVSDADNNEQLEASIGAPISAPVELSASVESALATRNMLRSRKRKLESDAKKSSGAEERQSEAQQVKPQPAPDVPSIETLPEQGFVADSIDPAVVKKANQVDKWANMIDTMALNGRLRVLAQHAIISPVSSDEQLVLSLNQSAKHLKTEVAMEQLQAFVSDYFQQPMEVAIELVDDTEDDPLKIQGQINERRYEYAKSLLQQDPLIQSLQQQFQAELDESTIIAR